MDTDDLKRRVADWLAKEGYPLESRTARVFQEHRFGVRQSYFVRDIASDKPREIDVLAEVQTKVGERLLRIAYVVECKWSVDKPWVMFCSDASMAPSACIAQSISSELGRAVVWCAAGDSSLHGTDTFCTPRYTAFGGRQPFSGNSDIVFNSLQSVAAAARSYVDRYAGPAYISNKLPTIAEVAFPVIVVQGLIFESTLDPATKDLKLRQVPRVRLYWRGSEAWGLHATIDVVSEDALSDFVATRVEDLETLIRVFATALEGIESTVHTGDWNSLPVSGGPRGTLGLPRLLARLRQEQKLATKAVSSDEDKIELAPNPSGRADENRP